MANLRAKKGKPMLRIKTLFDVRSLIVSPTFARDQTVHYATILADQQAAHQNDHKS